VTDLARIRGWFHAIDKIRKRRNKIDERLVNSKLRKIQISSETRWGAELGDRLGALYDMNA